MCNAENLLAKEGGNKGFGVHGATRGGFHGCHESGRAGGIVHGAFAPPNHAPGIITMLAAPDRPPPLPGYNLHPPTEADALAALQRVFGAERAAGQWALACREAGLVPGAVIGTPALERVVTALSAQGGATATVARSIEIRMRTYARLARQTAALAGGAR